MRGVAALCALSSVAAACGGAPGSAPAPTIDPLAGRYSMSGGGGALQVVRALTEAFAKLHPGVIWVIEDVGSDAGIQLTAGGRADLGMISRDLKENEKGLVKTEPIGVSGTGVSVNAANPITGLTKQQVRDIFAGTITDWKDTGGQPGKITVLVRETDAATRSSFESFFFGGRATYARDAIEVFEIEETIKSIRSFKDSVGMVTVNERTLHEPGIKLVAIDGVAPNRENLANGTYLVRRPLFLVYHPTTVKPAIQAFLDFVRAPQGQQIVAAN